MIIKTNKKVLVIILVILTGIIATVSLFYFTNSPQIMVAGGTIHPALDAMENSISVSNQQDTDASERFQRPSKGQPFPNPYSFEDFKKEDERPPLITKKFESPEDLLLAYYGILRNASNMSGYSGGCGTIGEVNLPYPYAYELLTKEKQNEVSLTKFIDSFRGIGYITLLKIVPAYIPPKMLSNIKYYMVEFEVITGAKANNNDEYSQGSLFAYYYGLVTVKKTPKDGWKIDNIDYMPEDFLCAPMHGWFYDSDMAVQIVYGDNLKIIEQIDKAEKKGDTIQIYASGFGKQYRFDFIRLINGYDILLHENVLENGVWKEGSLLTDKWEYLKLSNQFGIT
jgi:hypothetical protein